MMKRPLLLVLFCAVPLTGCVAGSRDLKNQAAAQSTQKIDFAADRYPSTYQAAQPRPVLIRNATVLVGDGTRLEGADVFLKNGRVAGVGHSIAVNSGSDVVEIDGTGKWVTPGIIDTHSHLGSNPTPRVWPLRNGNESTSPVTAQAWIEHSIWTQDPGFSTALAGGVTTLHVMPGSANLIGGRTVTLKNSPAITVQDMKFPGAPHGLKVACGENPRRSYGSRGGPMTRMGTIAGYRSALLDAQDYASKRRANPTMKRDLKLDTLAAAIEGDILVHIHCYRSDEMVQMIDLSKEFDFKIAAFHHATEAYKISDRLAREGICGALWGDWWGFKLEAWDGIQENVALVDLPENGCAVVHSDSDEGVQRLNQEAAKVIANARRVGMDIAPERAIRWLTSNAAKTLGVHDSTGTLEVGKMADVVLWNGNPFSVYARAERVYVDGVHLYQRGDRQRRPKSDFMLGVKQ